MSKSTVQHNPRSDHGIWLDAGVARELLALAEGQSATTSLDLGRDRCRVERAGERLITAEGQILPREGLERVVQKADRLFRLVDERYEVAEVRAQRYSVLRPAAGGGAPGLELDGISMHLRSSGDPWESTRAMAAAVGPAGKAVLDCCGGLGYVAIHAARLGAREVVSVECCPEVLVLRRTNPWSAGLDDERIECVIGDIRKLVREWPAGRFGAIVHDPPRLGRRTGDLYGRPFYQELFRLMAPGGWLLHYLGRPGTQKGTSSTARVPKRLQEVGFWDLEHLREIQCCRLRKPLP